MSINTNTKPAVSPEEIKEFEMYSEQLNSLDFDEPVNDTDGFKPKSTMANYKDKYPKQYPPFNNLANVPEPDTIVDMPDVLQPDEPVEKIITKEVQEKVKKSSKRLGINWYGLNFTLVKADSERLKNQETLLEMTTENVSFHFDEV
jgi:hypothetical protein